MTNQNVVISDTKLGIGMAIHCHVNSSVFSTVVPKPPAVPGKYIAISRKKFLKKIETGNGGGARVNAWVDSMRASSPTHVKSTSSLSQNEDHSSWMVLLQS